MNIRLCLGLATAYLLIAIGVSAQERTSTAPQYHTPDPALAAIVDAPPTPAVSLDPSREHLLIMHRAGQPTIAELSEPELRIAGLRINPRTNGPSRGGHYTGLTILDIATNVQRAITGIPEGAQVTSVSWAPDGSTVAFCVTDQDGITLWTANAPTARANRLIAAPLNGIWGAPYRWLSDSAHLICCALPKDRGGVPEAPAVPLGPTIQETTGEVAAARTYQDLLEDAHDERLFEYFGTSQVLKVALDGTLEELGEPGIHQRIEPSPDASYLLVETIHRPFSYLVPYYRFPSRVDVWNADGSLAATLADLPLAESVPIGRGAVPTGPRNYGWRNDAPASLSFVEAQDGGDPRAEADIRDTVYLLEAPNFEAPPRKLIDLSLRYAGIAWGTSELALVNESWWSTRQVRTWRIRPDGASPNPEVLFDRSYEDRYNDPGSPVFVPNKWGEGVLLLSADSSSIYLDGAGASPEGDRPFIDRFNLRTKESERLWRSAAPYYESFVTFLDVDQGLALTRRESQTVPANYFARSLPDGDLKQLTSFPHPYPELSDVYKEVVHYERDDGVQLQATLYLPPGRKPEDGPLPMLMWAYPREYKDADAAGQVQGSPYQFKTISVGGPLPFLATGYAVFDGPTMPIIGEGDEEPNDTFVEQLVANAKAAVDEVVRRGVAERDRIAIGGHSYGAFMTGNLLAHSDLFAAGIARSGAYNRTLTPFGFQSEERTFWEAPHVYFEMSPFMHADTINEPILFIHGEADNNSGTFPLQSERMFNAVKGHGAKARLVMLPHESHGYAARESQLHMLWEMNDWLDRFVKHFPE